MCDCYEHPCEIAGCKNGIPMHIGEFKFPRDTFTVWCADHLDYAKPGAVVFEIVESRDEDEPEGWSCAILGPEVGDTNGGDNHPNLFSRCRETVVA